MGPGASATRVTLIGRAVGEELATARALSELSHKLVDAAAIEIEEFEGRRVHLHG